jgi:hypothetical protein
MKNPRLCRGIFIQTVKKIFWEVWRGTIFQQQYESSDMCDGFERLA